MNSVTSQKTVGKVTELSTWLFRKPAVYNIRNGGKRSQVGIYFTSSLSWARKRGSKCSIVLSLPRMVERPIMTEARADFTCWLVSDTSSWSQVRNMRQISTNKRSNCVKHTDNCCDIFTSHYRGNTRWGGLNMSADNRSHFTYNAEVKQTAYYKAGPEKLPITTSWSQIISNQYHIKDFTSNYTIANGSKSDESHLHFTSTHKWNCSILNIVNIWAPRSATSSVIFLQRSGIFDAGLDVLAVKWKNEMTTMPKF